MKFKPVYLWFLTAFIFYFMNIGAGIVLTLVAIVMVSQEKQIELLRKQFEEENSKEV